MFGYLQVRKSELLVREWEAYKAVYCGLCKQMGKDYPFLTRLSPFPIAFRESSNTPTQTRALVRAVKGSIEGSSPPDLTMIRVFCSVRIDTSASIKPIVRSSQTRLSEVALRLLRAIDATTILYVV